MFTNSQVEPTRFTLRIPRLLYDAMLAQAVAELPNECCGLLAGKIDGAIGVVSHWFPLRNVAEQPMVEYLSEPRGMFAAEKAMRSESLDALAVYHSHPTSDPVPSRKDCERSFAESVLNLIISLKGGQPRVRAWWLANPDFFEGRWEVSDGIV
jgi:proteasome lid subunit RPN8/RPN11